MRLRFVLLTIANIFSPIIIIALWSGRGLLPRRNRRTFRLG
jgi:hypothetical protein